ncbi:MAG: SsrA-binding protein SmpB [Fimbriimonadaceae bacterium]|nr:SsrA-binding protein SmpB [Fimbriimonadaceae bacterium]QYK55427.1 MAG: SsrA-binding protein SmpB [Fimbriimonadaceae bacterium]
MAAKGSKKDEKKGPATIEHRKARYDYEFVETHEAGVALVGTEVKSVYLGRANLTDAYCAVEDGELWLHNLDVEPYDKSSHFGHDRRRKRKLLMHRREIDSLKRKSQEKGLTIVPYKVYFNEKGRVKVAIALARGKREYDKREALRAKETRRELQRGE